MLPKLILKGLKTVSEKENAGNQNFPRFPRKLSKALFTWLDKSQDCVVKS